MRRIRFVCMVFWVFALSYGICTPATDIFQNKRLMVIVNDAGNAEGFTEYAESVLKKRLKSVGCQIINPELIKTVRSCQ